MRIYRFRVKANAEIIWNYLCFLYQRKQAIIICRKNDVEMRDVEKYYKNPIFGGPKCGFPKLEILYVEN